MSDRQTLRADYLVGCDGGRSLVRKAAGIEFAGLDPSTSWMIAEVTMDGEPELGFRRDGVGTHALGPAGDGESVRVVLTERQVEHTGEPSMSELREALVGVYGTGYGFAASAGSPGHRPRACWTPITPNGIRSVPGCCTTPWRTSRSPVPTTDTRPSAT